jgi:5'(3')-deoxyribonucleotidase
MRIGIDFDGVLCERDGIPRGDEWIYSLPVDNAQEAITFLMKQHDVYVFTNRTKKDWPQMKEWLNDHGFPEMRITNKKLPNTKIYIDDRCLRFTNWLDVCKYFG